MNHPDTHLSQAFLIEDIRQEMLRQRISRAHMAQATGINQTTLHKKLTGLTPLRLNEAEVIADVLGVALWELLRQADRKAVEYMETRYTLGPKLVEVS